MGSLGQALSGGCQDVERTLYAEQAFPTGNGQVDWPAAKRLVMRVEKGDDRRRLAQLVEGQAGHEPWRAA